MKLRDLLVRLASLREQNRDVIVLIDGFDIEIIIEGDPEAVDLFATTFARSGKEIET